jgi:hypothetical protein
VSRAFTGWTNAGSAKPWFPGIVNRMFPQTLVSTILGYGNREPGSHFMGSLSENVRSRRRAQVGWQG